MTSNHPTFDGMPEPPPAWVRPDEAVRMSALALDMMLAAALPHCSGDEDFPVLDTIRIEVVAGQLITQATDRFTLIRERRLVNQTCPPFTFLLRSGDAKALRVLLRGVLRGLDKDVKDLEPVDLALEATDEGPSLRVLGQDLDVRFTEEQGEYPTIDSMADRLLEQVATRHPREFPIALNPTLLARVVAAQNAGRAGRPFRYSCPTDPDGRNRPVLVQPVVPDGELDDDLLIAVMPVSDVGADTDGAQPGQATR